MTHGQFWRFDAPCPIRVSAPGRIDFSDVDLPGVFYRMPNGCARTLNFAIGRRVELTFAPQDRLSTSSLVCDAAGAWHPVSTSYIDYVLAHFGAPRGSYCARSNIPFKSGLGGSSALVVALLSMMHALQKRVRSIPPGSLNAIALHAVSIENSMGITTAGYQDALAACWGGGNFWEWGARDLGAPICWSRRQIFDPTADGSEFSTHFLLGYTGEPHGMNLADVGFGSTQVWNEIGLLCAAFADAIDGRDWRTAAEVAFREWELRQLITKVSDRQHHLITLAHRNGASARFTGTGPGGCVWAVGEVDSISSTRHHWGVAARSWEGAFVETPALSPGVMIESLDSNGL
jgi:D-glycero-alpha-D-manno-heptose-7-phosphate kinase